MTFGRSWRRATFGRALAYVLAQGVVWLLTRLEIVLTGDARGANLGAAVVFFAVQSLGAFAWALADGRRGVRAIPLLVRWVIVAFASAVSDLVLFALTPGAVSEGSDPDPVQLFGAYVTQAFPRNLGLILVPAVLGGAIGVAASSAATRAD